jgi:hypothetical protein
VKLDVFVVRIAKSFRLDPCVVVAWVAWALSWRPEVRAVRREILCRVQKLKPSESERLGHSHVA